MTTSHGHHTHNDCTLFIFLNLVVEFLFFFNVLSCKYLNLYIKMKTKKMHPEAIGVEPDLSKHHTVFME